MRKLLLCISCVAILLTFCCCKKNQVKVVLSPKVVQNSDANLSVDKVILTDSMTIIDCSFLIVNGNNGNWVFTTPQAFISADGKNYPIIGSKNIPMVNIKTEMIHFRTITFSLIFPPIPLDTKSIDFAESNVPNDGWVIKGIDLTSTSTAIKYDDKKASEAYAQRYKKYEQSLVAYSDSYNTQSSDSYDSNPSTSYNAYLDALHYFYCPSCGTLVQASLSHRPSPNSGQCTRGYHTWGDLGKVGTKYTYFCDRCGLSIVCDSDPSSSNCCIDHRLHHWIRRN